MRKNSPLRKYIEQGVPPIAIVLTMPEKWFQETGHTYESALKHMLKCLNEDEDEWLFLKSSLPTKDFLHVYIIWNNKVQIRACLSRLERCGSYAWRDTPDGRERAFENKNWIVLCAPAEKAPIEFECSGFQGFRYLTKEIW